MSLQYVYRLGLNEDYIYDIWGLMLDAADTKGILSINELNNFDRSTDYKTKNLYVGVIAVFLDKLEKGKYNEFTSDERYNITENDDDPTAIINTYATNIFLTYAHFSDKLEEVKNVVLNHDDPFVKKIGTRLYKILQKLLKEQEEETNENKKKIAAAKKKLQEQSKNEAKRTKEAAKREKEKQEKRTKNKFCKNTIEYITQEDIEDIPTEDLTFIKLDKAIFCFDKDSFKNMIKYAKDQKVRGACKTQVPEKPLECDWFYPINIGNNIYISEDNYNKVNKHIGKRKFSLKNKRIVDFTTGLHIMSEKSGNDVVYDLVPDKYDIKEVKAQIGGKKKIKRKNINKIVENMKNLKSKTFTVQDLRKRCKDKGIKGYSKMKKSKLVNICFRRKYY